MDPDQNTHCVYILTDEHFSGGVIETISDEEVPEGDNKVGEDIAVCALEDVEKRVMGLSPAEDNVVGEAFVECVPEDDVEDRAMSSPPEDDNEVEEALAACVPEADVEERPMFLLPEEENELGEALAVCAPEDDVEERAMSLVAEVDVEERAMALVPEEDNEGGEVSAVCAPEDDVEERSMSLVPEEDNEVGNALAAGAETEEGEEDDDDEDEDLTKREDYLKVMTDILKEFHISYENGLEAFMVKFIVDYVYSVIEDASLYSVFAKKGEIDMDDVELAMSMLQVKNEASAWAPELAQSLLKQRTVIQTSNSLSSTLPKPPHESETASTSSADSDVPLESQEKDNSNITEQNLFDKDIIMQTEESESPFSNQILQKILLSSTCPLLSLNTDEESAMETDDPPTI